MEDLPLGEDFMEISRDQEVEIRKQSILDGHSCLDEDDFDESSEG